MDVSRQQQRDESSSSNRRAAQEVGSTGRCLCVWWIGRYKYRDPDKEDINKKKDKEKKIQKIIRKILHFFLFG